MFSEWRRYEWRDQWDHGHVSELYSPWQLLYLADVLEGGVVELPLSWLSGEGEPIYRSHEGLRDLIERQRGAWGSLDDRWRPLIKLLVRLQNRYWPFVGGRLRLTIDPTTH